jgi:hypothetical protein
MDSVKWNCDSVLVGLTLCTFSANCACIWYDLGVVSVYINVKG